VYHDSCSFESHLIPYTKSSSTSLSLWTLPAVSMISVVFSPRVVCLQRREGMLADRKDKQILLLICLTTFAKHSTLCGTLSCNARRGRNRFLQLILLPSLVHLSQSRRQNDGGGPQFQASCSPDYCGRTWDPCCRRVARLLHSCGSHQTCVTVRVVCSHMQATKNIQQKHFSTNYLYQKTTRASCC